MKPYVSNQNYLHMFAHPFSQLSPSNLSQTPCFSIPNFLHRAIFALGIHLSVPARIPFHLILASQTFTLRYPSPPPPPIHPILLLLAWLIAETGPILCSDACKASLFLQAQLCHPRYRAPLRALITPHCRGIISGRDQILKHDGSVLVFKWSWSCWFLIRGAEDA